MSKSSKKRKTKNKRKGPILNVGSVLNGVMVAVLSAGVISLFEMNGRLYEIEQLIMIHEVQEH